MLRYSRLLISRRCISYFSGVKYASTSPTQNLKATMDLSDMRTAYNSDDVEKDFSEKDPIKLFDRWFAVARNADGIGEANAMALATADISGKPSVRNVLLKGYGNDGFRFFTNFGSRKGREMAENPNVALLFYWEPLHRQVRIEGTVVKLDEEESEQYFHSRPRSSQISAVVSIQSDVIKDRDILSQQHLELEEKYADENLVIPKPSNWGGYKVIPTTYEFWCGRTTKLHDRMRFRLPTSGENPDNKCLFSGENGWIYEYLFP